MADVLIPPLTVSGPLEASFHVLNRNTGIDKAQLASLLCYSDNGPITITVEGPTPRLVHFRPESTVYNPTNRAAGGNVAVPFGDGPFLPSAIVTFTNNGETDGEVALLVGFDVVPEAARVPLRLRRQLPAKASTTVQIAFIDQ